MFVGIIKLNSEIDPTKLKTVIAIINIFKLDLNFLCLKNTTNKDVLKIRLIIRRMIQYIAKMFNVEQSMGDIRLKISAEEKLLFSIFYIFLNFFKFL